MAENDIISKRTTFLRLLSLGRIYDALKMLRELSEQKLTWEISDEINKVDSSYSYLLRYAMEGVEDPQRHEIYKSLVADLVRIYDRLLRTVRMKDDLSSYYTTARQMHGVKVAPAVASYEENLHNSDAFANALGNGTDNKQLAEELETELFNAVWTSFPLSRDDRDALQALFTSETVPEYVKRLVISALMLGHAEYPDERRLEILAEVYESNADTDLGAIALTALLLSLYSSRDRSLSKRTKARLEMLRDIRSWRSDLKTAFLELIRTRDTERITRKLTDEIVPEMLKMKPELDKHMSKIKPEEIDPAEIEENPEWQDMLEQSGIANKIKELTELQEEGGDVMMGTFAHLKSFPFFYSVANWFLPFHTGHSLVGKLGEAGGSIASMIASAPYMCDSDKYSFMLAINGVPQTQRDFMTSQFKAQNLNAAELQASSMNLATDSRKNAINKYVQNLYRFFRLFRRKEDFSDPFASAINLTLVPLLAEDLAESDALQLVAEFCFSHQYYKEALDVFRIVEGHTYPEAQLYQKMGFCQQKLGNLNEALQYYEQAELLDSTSAWLTKRLALVCKQLGDYRRALDYYKRLDSMQPDSVSTIMNIGQCSLELGLYDEAVKAFYKADYLKPSVKTVRTLAWSLLMAKRFDAAEKEFKRLLETGEATPEDHLNIGHMQLALRKYREAIDEYAAYMLTSDSNFTTYRNAMRADTPALLKIGVAPEIIPLAIDAMAYKMNNI